MNTQAQQATELRRLAELIGHTKIAMMTTVESNGSLRSRPLATLQMDSEGKLWFFSAIDSSKVEEIAHHRQVNLSFSDPEKQDYVSVSGTAEIVRDPRKMRELWSAWVEPWFPDGLGDPSLVLMSVRIDQAEYWDAPASKVQRLFGLARAIATGDTTALGKHGRIAGPS
jgi:general stress protein 26